MPDPVTTGFATLAASHLLRESVTRLVAPTADYLGTELKELTEAQCQQLRRILSSAERKSGDRLREDGAVNARLFKKIVDDGRFCSDTLSAEYYGGLLAASRDRAGDEDTNIPFAAMINRMSSDQLHGHWILYAMLFNLMHNRDDLNLYILEHRKQASFYVPWRSFMFLFEELRTGHIEDEPAFKFLGSDRYHAVHIDSSLARKLQATVHYSPYGGSDFRRLDMVFYGLLNDRLVERIYWGLTGWDLGNRMKADYPSDPLSIRGSDPLSIRGDDLFAERMERIMRGATVSDHTSAGQGGVVFCPSILGVDLFLRVHGLPLDDHIGFDCLSYEFCPESFREEIMKDVRLVGASPPSD